MKKISKLKDIPLNKKIVLFGAGMGGVHFLEFFHRFRPGVKVDYFIDSNKSGELENLPIIPVQQFLQNKKEHAQVTIIIVSRYWEDMADLLLKNGIHDYLVIPLRFFYPPEFNDRFTEYERERYKEQLFRVRSLLSYPEDRRLYGILSGESDGFPSCFDAVGEYYSKHAARGHKQYFDHVHWDKVHTIIEGGVCNGVNTMAFSKWTDGRASIFGFEPNINLYSSGSYFGQIQSNPLLKIIPKGLWTQSGTAYMHDMASSSCILGEELKNINTYGDTSMIAIETISIDEFVDEQKIKKVDYIKMDIEGAELEALKGGINTLKNHRPQLAISIYHKRDDILSIPLFLDEHLENYTYRLGHYFPCFRESIWYGIPKELSL